MLIPGVQSGHMHQRSSAYAGKTIQVAFYFHAGDGYVYSDESTGWYIDDISLVTGL